MANFTDVRNGDLLVLDGEDQVISFKASKVMKPEVSEPLKLAYIKIVTSAAGVQVSSGEEIDEDFHAWVEGDIVPMSFLPGTCDLHVKGTAADEIAVSY